MKIIFTRIAERELEDSVRYYELQYSGLGRKFKEEVRMATRIHRISATLGLEEESVAA